MSTLYVVATPIGNLEDITSRAINVLLSVPVIACEDTRHTGQLIKVLKERDDPKRTNLTGSSPKFISIRDWNESESISKIAIELVQGHDVALVSDAGTPLISDPGYKLVRDIRAAGFAVITIPGPSALTAALSVSGLPTDRFEFLGFNHQDYSFGLNKTTVLYESPKRINATLKTIRAKHPSAEIVLAAELTKIHEQVWTWAGEEVVEKGEYVILVYLPADRQGLAE